MLRILSSINSLLCFHWIKIKINNITEVGRHYYLFMWTIVYLLYNTWCAEYNNVNYVMALLKYRITIEVKVYLKNVMLSPVKRHFKYFIKWCIFLPMHILNSVVFSCWVFYSTREKLRNIDNFYDTFIYKHTNVISLIMVQHLFFILIPIHNFIQWNSKKD